MNNKRLKTWAWAAYDMIWIDAWQYVQLLYMNKADTKWVKFALKLT